MILESLGLGPVRYHHGWRDSARLDAGAVREIALAASDDGHVVLMLYPGDSIAQVREFYDDVDRERFLSLARSGWRIRTNLHFAFIQKNMYWPEARVNLACYLSFWSEKSAIIQKWDREYFEEVFTALKAVGQLSQRGVDELRRLFVTSNRNSLNLCPGLELLYRWPTDEASRLDAAGLFMTSLRARLIEAFSSWKQPLPLLPA